MIMKKRVHALAAVYAIAASAVLSVALAGPAMAAQQTGTEQTGTEQTGTAVSTRTAVTEPVAQAPAVAPAADIQRDALLAVEQPADPNKKDDVKEPVATGPGETPGLLLLVVGLGAILASIVLVVRAGARRTARNF